MKKFGAIMSSTLAVIFVSPAFAALQHDSLDPEKQQKAEHSQDTQDDQNQSPPLLKDEPLHVKEENLQPELDDGSGGDAEMGSGFNAPSDEEFGPDRLSLVQSKLLEDWRPDPEQPQSNKIETVDPGPSQSLGRTSSQSFNIFSLLLVYNVIKTRF